MEKRIYTCDSCGQEQKADNHWFSLIITNRTGGNVLTLAALGSIKEANDKDQLFHLCGEGCASRKVSEFLGGL